jgi:hypothetical protein
LTQWELHAWLPPNAHIESSITTLSPNKSSSSLPEKSWLRSAPADNLFATVTAMASSFRTLLRPA